LQPVERHSVPKQSKTLSALQKPEPEPELETYDLTVCTAVQLILMCARFMYAQIPLRRLFLCDEMVCDFTVSPCDKSVIFDR